MTKSILICAALLIWACLGSKLVIPFFERSGYVNLKTGDRLTRQANPMAFKLWMAFTKLILVYGPIIGVGQVAIKWMVQGSPPF